jgi:hypothetical protein
MEIFWSLTAIASLFAIMFILTRERMIGPPPVFRKPDARSRSPNRRDHEDTMVELAAQPIELDAPRLRVGVGISTTGGITGAIGIGAAVFRTVGDL